MTVFGSAERPASWVSICPGNNESAGKRKSGRIRRGNAWVRWLLCEFAQAAARTRCALKAKFDSLAIGKGHKKSVVALAYKMLRTIYAMLASGTHYQDRNVDYRRPKQSRHSCETKVVTPPLTTTTGGPYPSNDAGSQGLRSKAVTLHLTPSQRSKFVTSFVTA